MRVAAAPAGPSPAPSGAGGVGVLFVKGSAEPVAEQQRTVVLWVSRHRPLPAQIAELERKLGPVEIVQVEHVPNAEHVIEVAKRVGARVIVPVLPLSFIARLVEEAGRHGYTVLMARMEAVATTRSVDEARRLLYEAPERRSIATYADGTIRVFEFVRFERIKKVEVVTEPW